MSLEKNTTNLVESEFKHNSFKKIGLSEKLLNVVKMLLLNSEKQNKSQRSSVDDSSTISVDSLIHKTSKIQNEKNTENSTEQIEIANKINKYLDNNLLEMVIMAQDNGYLLSKEQKEKFKASLLKLLSQNDLTIINMISDKKYDIDDEILIKWLFDYDAKLAESFITEKHDGKWKDKKFVESIISYAQKLVEESNNSIEKYKRLSRTPNADYVHTVGKYLYEQSTTLNIVTNICFHKIEPTLKLDKYVDFLETCTKNIAFIESVEKNSRSPALELLYKPSKEILANIEKMRFHIATCFLEDKKSFVEKVQSNNLGNLLENKTIENNLHHARENSLSQLPELTKKMLEEINEKMRHLLKDKKGVAQDKLAVIEKLYSERIPEIVSTYVSIVPEYRQTLVNVDNKTPEQLMNRSLNDVKEVLEKVLEENNQSKVDSLSATQRYTSNVKNSI